MNRFHQTVTFPMLCALFSAMIPTSLWGQARPIEVPELNSRLTSTGVANLRVGAMSDDGTETLLIMEYRSEEHTSELQSQ